MKEDIYVQRMECDMLHKECKNNLLAWTRTVVRIQHIVFKSVHGFKYFLTAIPKLSSYSYFFQLHFYSYLYVGGEAFKL